MLRPKISTSTVAYVEGLTYGEFGQISQGSLRSGLRGAAFVLTSVCLLAAVGITTAHAQTFSVLYTLNPGFQGNGLYSGLTADREGNLYGAAFAGGINNCPEGYGCGTVFKLSRHGTG